MTTGPYLRDLAAAIPARAFEGYYCGIDTSLFKPVTVDGARGACDCASSFRRTSS